MLENARTALLALLPSWLALGSLLPRSLPRLFACAVANSPCSYLRFFHSTRLIKVAAACLVSRLASRVPAGQLAPRILESALALQPPASHITHTFHTDYRHADPRNTH